MIEHMVSETNRMFKGTTQKMFYLFFVMIPYALSLMKANENRKWMNKKIFFLYPLLNGSICEQPRPQTLQTLSAW